MRRLSLLLKKHDPSFDQIWISRFRDKRSTVIKEIWVLTHSYWCEQANTPYIEYDVYFDVRAIVLYSAKNDKVDELKTWIKTLIPSENFIPFEYQLISCFVLQVCLMFAVENIPSIFAALWQHIRPCHFLSLLVIPIKYLLTLIINHQYICKIMERVFIFYLNT